MELRLCAPAIHSLLTRNWNAPSDGSALMASSVPNICSVSTPLRTFSVMRVMIFSVVSGWWSGDPGAARGGGPEGCADARGERRLALRGEQALGAQPKVHGQHAGGQERVRREAAVGQRETGRRRAVELADEHRVRQRGTGVERGETAERGRVVVGG